MLSSKVRRPLLLLLPLAALLVAPPPGAGASDLVAFLERAERMTAVNEKLRVDITVQEADGSQRKAVATLDPAGGGTLLFEQAETGWRSTTPLAWRSGRGVSSTGAKEREVGVDEPLGNTGLRGIDFFPWWKADYRGAMVSDDNAAEKVVTLYADKSQPYSLYVITFDKTRFVPRLMKLYRESFNNLVRIRTDKDHVMVGARPRPTKMLIRDYADDATRTYTLDWKVLP
jgi:hypothetical protein